MDNRLEGAQVKLRPSQDKFQGLPDLGDEGFCLNVSDAFTRPGLLRLSALRRSSLRSCRPYMRVEADHLVMSFARMFSATLSRCTLYAPAALPVSLLLLPDRPLISALDDLGISIETFVRYQKLAVDALAPSELETLKGALSVLHRFAFGGATRFKRCVLSDYQRARADLIPFAVSSAPSHPCPVL